MPRVKKADLEVTSERIKECMDDILTHSREMNKGTPMGEALDMAYGALDDAYGQVLIAIEEAGPTHNERK